ncbi:MAG: type IV toxin-antitoxin system AbiEi family antitoxin domain-containing protein [Patescibacteria group bacterium]|nr:type IV toxin-antitoxin system AbiEi family antitoxin domain-containing protein [Patescibacteria group bacterium]
MDNLLLKLYQSSKTILTTKEIALLWKERNKDNLKSKIFYYVKKGWLIRLRKGIFAKNKKYNLKELSVSIYTPSYISFETVLREEGIIFQHHNATFVASYLSKEILCGKNKIIFRKLKDAVLINQNGIINKNNFCQASKERAFLDMIYLFKNYHFDNLDSLNWKKCFELTKIYHNKELVKRLQKYHQNA